MKLNFRPFEQFVQLYVVPKTIARAQDSIVTYIDVSNTAIKARVRGTKSYNVNVVFNGWEVVRSSCNCSYDPRGYCEHIVNVLIHADRILNNRKIAESYQQSSLFDVQDDTKTINIEQTQLDNEETLEDLLINDSQQKLNVSFQYNSTTEEAIYTIVDQQILQLTDEIIINSTHPKLRKYDPIQDFTIQNAELSPNKLTAIVTAPWEFYFGNKIGTIELSQEKNNIVAKCSCKNKTHVICPHVIFVLSAVINKHLHLYLSFDHQERHKYLSNYALREGEPNIANFDEIYSLFVPKVKLTVKKKVSVFSPQAAVFNSFVEDFGQVSIAVPQNRLKSIKTEENQEFILFKTDAKLDGTLECELLLLETSLYADGEMKSDVRVVPLSQRLSVTKNKDEIMFLSAFLALLESNRMSVEKKEMYRWIFNNPLQLPFYRQHTDYDWRYKWSKVNVSKFHKIEVLDDEHKITIHVNRHTNDSPQEFYSVDLRIEREERSWSMQNFEILEHLVFVEDKVLLVQNDAIFNAIRFFEQHKGRFLVHKTQFSDFQETFIRSIEQSIPVVYDFVQTTQQLTDEHKVETQEFPKRLIYLSESDDYILITPTVRYENVEVGVFSPKNIYLEDAEGKLYLKPRDKDAEEEFIELLRTQHQAFEQRPTTHFFYLHYSEFMDNMWFQEAFETWKKWNVEVLGYKNLKNNYNPNKMSASLNIASGIDWFDLETDISFGEQRVNLQEIQRSIINKNHFVVLGDGTKGLLPQEWIAKFERYFRTGELKSGKLRIHKSNFQLIDELFEKEILPESVQIELSQYIEKLSNFQSIQQINPPKELKASLREYQKEGLNWLNFLYDFNFGGCLADDMGLGKTIQIISYLLLRKEKGNTLPNLVIMPTSLLFNWQHEVEKFAPNMRYIVLYGNNRQTETIEFANYDLILTSYGTMLSDIDTLRHKHFDVIVLDESQAIKNPTSKRYKAVQLLHARQRVVATGTPIENNTFDLYAQLSFAMPGLLGSQKQFATHYSTPIDKFGDAQRAKELHQKIHPFVLRRTKQQVATELPPKTEITIYCPMEKHQQKVYDAYRAEFQRYLAGLSDEQMHKSALNVLQGLTKLRQICNSPALLSDEEFYGEESAKIDELIRQINKLKDDHKILVFSQFVSMLELIKQRLNDENISHAYLTGQTKDRQRQVDNFQNDSSIRVFLISLKAGGTGLNLTEAEYVFIVDPWWNPAVENQAIDRAYRIGQKNKVMAMRLITPNTIEEKIMELQARKSQLAQDLIRTDEQVFKRLSKDELINIL